MTNSPNSAPTNAERMTDLESRFAQARSDLVDGIRADSLDQRQRRGLEDTCLNLQQQIDVLRRDMPAPPGAGHVSPEAADALAERPRTSLVDHEARLAAIKEELSGGDLDDQRRGRLQREEDHLRYVVFRLR